MKTLVLYATKHGAARLIAEKIASRIDGAAIHDLKQGSIPALANSDCVIIGSSIYAGMIHKEAKKYITENADALKGKRLGLFLSGMSPDEKKVAECFAMNFPEVLLSSAKEKAFLGGIFDPKKTGFFERNLYKMVAKQAEYADIIDYDKIEQFAEAMAI